MKKSLIALIITIISTVSLLILRCTEGTVAGNGSQTPNSGIIGKLYNPDGSPAANAKVYAVPSDHNPISDYNNRTISSIIDSTTTNDKGEYAFDSLIKGYYNLLGYKEKLSSFNDSIYIPGTTQETEAPPDTLKGTGSLHGVIKLQPGDNANTVFILIFGTYTWTAPSDSVGNFDINNLAEGVYHVKFLTTLNDYDHLDTALTIRAGMNDTLNDTLIMPFAGIPVPSGVDLSYDTMKQIVTLTWNRCDLNKVKGYNVYRKNVDSNTTFATINKTLITDTIFCDSSGIQDLTYEYKITAIDTGDNESKKSTGLSVKIVSYFTFIASFGSQGTGDGQFNEISDVIQLCNSNIAVCEYGNHNIQIFDTSGHFIKKIGKNGTNNGEFVYPIGLAADTECNIYALEMLGPGRIQMFDTMGIYQKSWIVGQYCRGICLRNNRLYVSSTNPKAIKIIDVITDSITTIATDQIDPFGIDFDTASNELFIADNIHHRIVRIDTLGNIINTWGSLGSALGNFHSPTFLSISPKNNIYVADMNNKRIQIFSKQGILLAIGINKLTRPGGICINTSDHCYVGDQFRVKKYLSTF